jgi:hypothetical protein
MIDEIAVQNDHAVVENTLENNHEVPQVNELEEVKKQNWRMMRETAERDRQRAAQLEQELQEMRRAQQPKQSEPDDLDSDDIAEKRHIKKYRDEQRKENERLLKKTEELEQKMQQMHTQSVLNEVCATYPDFKNIVTDATLAQLKLKEPELFDTVMENPDQRKKLIAAYKNIKAYVTTKNYDSHDAKIAENKAKPRTAANVPSQDATTPLATFSESARWKLSPAEAKALREDTARCARNR